jgi:hypothetical protein
MNAIFSEWFTQAYQKWVQAQPGEEDFLGFCSQLGYPPYMVLSWLHGEAIPKDSEVLSIAGLFGVKVYDLLELKRPDQELLEIFEKLSHLPGELRSNLSHALWEAISEINSKKISNDFIEMQKVIHKFMKKWNVA